MKLIDSSLILIFLLFRNQKIEDPIQAITLRRMHNTLVLVISSYQNSMARDVPTNDALLSIGAITTAPLLETQAYERSSMAKAPKVLPNASLKAV